MAKRMRKGASYVPGDRFATAKAGQNCRVLLLDGSECVVDMDKKSLGQVVFDHVLRKLEILERDYFGLQFEDEERSQQWLDLHKPVKKQLKKPPFQLMFRVKYYVTNPRALHSSSRNQFYLQLRLDISESRLFLPLGNTPSILSYILQADTGDYESDEKDSEYLAEHTLLHTQSRELRSEVIRFHQLHRGMNPKEAVNNFLKKVAEVESYGSHYWSIKYEDLSYQLGLSPTGLSIYQDTKKLSAYPWSCVVQLSYKSKKFTLKLRGHKGDPAEGATMTLDLESSKACKDVWKSTIDSISFYTDANRKSPEYDSTSTPTSPSTPLSPHHDGLVFHPSGSPVHPVRRETMGSSTPREDHSKALTKSQKTKSLPRPLPGRDPILVALKGHKDQRPSRHLSDLSSPTSPDDVFSTSASEGPPSPRHSEYRSPLSGEKELYPREEEELRGGRPAAGHLEKASPQQGQKRPDESDAHDYDYPPSSSPSTAPASSSNLDGQDTLSHDDMHDSLLDLADALGSGSGTSVEQRSDEKEEDIDVPLHGMETERRAHSSESTKASQPSPDHEHLSQPTSSILDSLDENSPLPPLPGTEGEPSPPPKPPRKAIQPPSPTHQQSSRDTKKQSRHLVRHWVQEHQLRSIQSIQSPQPSTPSSHSQASSQGRPSPELRSPSVRSPEPLSPSPLTVHCSVAPTERTSGSRPNTAESSRSTLSSVSTGSMPPTSTTSPSVRPSAQTSRGLHAYARRVEEPTSRELDRSKEDRRILPLASPPVAYRLPSPERERAHQPGLKDAQQSPKRQSTDDTEDTEVVKGLDSPDLTSVDDVLISLGVPPTNSASSSPVITSAPRGVSFRSPSPELEHTLEHTVGSQAPSNDVSRYHQGAKPLARPAREHDSEVPASTQARHQRRGMERQLRRTQKRFQQAMTNGDDHDHEEDFTRSGSSSPDITLHRFSGSHLGAIDPADLVREGMEIDPRNLIDAPSPIYDKLENLPAPMDSSPVSAGGFSPGQDPYYVPAGGGDNLLDEVVMSSDDLPPPPPHLAALSQELELDEQIPAPSPFRDPQVQPDAGTVTSVTTGGLHSPKQFDPKFFVKSVKLDKLADRPTAPPAVSRYPPEIASFMSRVRNRSMDADSQTSRDGASLHEDEEEEEREEKEPMNPSELFDQASPMVKRRQLTGDRAQSSTKATEQPPTQKRRSTEFHSDNRAVSDLAAVAITQGSGSPSRRKAETGTGRRGPMEVSPPQRYRDTAKSWDASEQRREKTTPNSSPSRGKANLGHSWDSRTHKAMQREPADGGSSRRLHEPDPKRNSFGPSSLEPQHGVPRREPHGSSVGTRQELGRSWTDDVAQIGRDYFSQQPSMKSFSLPRGQGSPRLSQYRHDSSRESTPSISQTHSDFTPTYHPHELHSYPNPLHYPGRYNPRSQDLELQRARSFGARPEQPFTNPSFHRHRPEEDSLPSSPTFFTHNPPDRDDSTPSPNTQAVNVSFQEHLNLLDYSRKGRKSRVMDWFQRTSDVWSYDSRHPMKRDPNADRPTMPYTRQSPVYASAEEVLEDLQRTVEPSHQPQPTQQRPLTQQQQWQAPMHHWQQPGQHQPAQQTTHPGQRQPLQAHQQNHRYQPQPPPPQRSQQVPQPNHQRQHPHDSSLQQLPSQQYLPYSRPPENGSYHPHTYAGRGHPSRAPVQYPTATFTKDYYVIDV